ncbi:penicillin acylase family protein [Azotobacter sp. CWF10]
MDEEAAQPGAMPARAMPQLLREDYVANMNDSYWLSNVHQPLEGFPAVLGGERQPLSLRGRLGHRIARELSEGEAQSTQALSRRLMQAVLTPRAYSAELFKDELLAQACAQPVVVLDGDDLQAADPGRSVKVGLAARKVEVAQACEVLRQWSGKADADARGALLWEAFWTRLDKTPDDALYRVAFSSAAPLDTPRAPGPDDGRVARALAAAVLSLTARGGPWMRRFPASASSRAAATGCRSTAAATRSAISPWRAIRGMAIAWDRTPWPTATCRWCASPRTAWKRTRCWPMARTRRRSTTAAARRRWRATRARTGCASRSARRTSTAIRASNGRCCSPERQAVPPAARLAKPGGGRSVLICSASSSLPEVIHPCSSI